MPDSQNINTSGQATIGHKFSILGHKSSIWFKQHLPPPAAYSPLSLPLTSVMEWIPNLGTEQAQEITQGEKRIKERFIQLDQLSSLSHCMAAKVLAGVRRARRGHFWSAYMQTQLWPQDLLYHISYIRGTITLRNFFPSPYLWLFLSQSGNQSDPANNGTDTTTGMVQRQQLPKARLLQEEKMKLCPSIWKKERCELKELSRASILAIHPAQALRWYLAEGEKPRGKDLSAKLC